MKKTMLLTFCALISSAAAAWADPVPAFQIKTAGGERIILLSEFDRGTVTPSGLELSLRDGSKEVVAYSSIERLELIDASGATFANSPRGFSLWPLPARESVNISLNLDAEVAMYSADGKLLMLISLKRGQTTLDTSCLPSGTILMRVGDSVIKFVKE